MLEQLLELVRRAKVEAEVAFDPDVETEQYKRVQELGNLVAMLEQGKVCVLSRPKDATGIQKPVAVTMSEDAMAAWNFSGIRGATVVAVPLVDNVTELIRQQANGEEKP